MFAATAHTSIYTCLLLLLLGRDKMMRLDVLLALASLKQFHYQLYIGDVALATALRSTALIKQQFTWTVSIKLLLPNYLTSFFSVVIRE